MAVFCHFWRLRPDEFWALPVRDYSAMVAYMNRLAAKRGADG